MFLHLRIGEGEGLRIEGQVRKGAFSDEFHLVGELYGDIIWTDRGVHITRDREAYTGVGRGEYFYRIGGPMGLQ